jgi:hypothetical protein
MTFEQLQEIAKEQDTRIFSLDCHLNYMTRKEFTNSHFRQLRQRVIEHSCWEALLKLHFPFENVVVNVEFVFAEDTIHLTAKTTNAITFKFGLFILNQACLSISDMKSLIYNFVEVFDHQFTHTFSIPAEMKTSTLIINIKPNHSIFKVLYDNNLI